MPAWALSEQEAACERLAARVSHSEQAPRLAEALLTVPEAIRAISPYFRMLQGDLLAAEREDALALTLYRSAQALAPEPGLAREIAVRRFASLSRLGQQAEASELSLSLAQEAPALSPYGRALWEYYRGVWHWRKGEIDAARERLADVLAMAEREDRRVTFLQFSARYALSAAAVDLASVQEAREHAERLTELALREGFLSGLLTAFVQRINATLLDQRRVPPLDDFLEMPGEAFEHASEAGLFDLMTTFGIRALAMGQLALADALFSHLVAEMRGVSRHRVAIAKFWLMHVQARQGNLEAARATLAELGPLARASRFSARIGPAWASLLLQVGCPAEAADALRQTDEAALGADDRLRVRLYRLVAGTMLGDEQAPAKLKDLLAAPEGEHLRMLEARLLARVGMGEAMPPLCLHLLGQPCLQAGEDAIAFPRRKVLSLLALLALHPDGLSSTELIERLFPASEDVEPHTALRKTVYLARQALKASGMPDPIQRVGGCYRLNDERFALIDSRELERLHAKALDCEANGHRRAARFFHRIGSWLGAATPFEGLPEPCFADPRERLAIVHERMLAFLRGDDLAVSPHALRYQDAWALLDAQRPDLAGHIRAQQVAREGGDEEGALTARKALLIETSLGDRLGRIARGLLLVQESASALRDASEALAWTERLMAHAARHPADVDRLLAHALRLHARQLDAAGRLPLTSLLELPPEWLVDADPASRDVYLAALGLHFASAGHPRLASQLLTRLRERAASPLLAAALGAGEAAIAEGGRTCDAAARLRLFGAPAVQIGEETIRFPRKKCLSLIALLALHPEGLSVARIFAMLYPDARHANAKKTIYSLVASTRQALDAGGAAGLIVSLPGRYRLNAKCLGRSDLSTFDALCARAIALERLGAAAVAADFLWLAADLAGNGPLCDGLNEACFDEPRRSREAEAQRGRA